MLFGRKKHTEPSIKFNPETQKAVLRCSICNGEKVAGFKDIKTGHFSEVMLIKDDRDLEYFKDIYQIDSITKEY